MQHKRPLPPTPNTSTKYKNVNDAIQSLLSDTSYDDLTDRERKWYSDLANCHKTLEQKDSVINNLKTIVVEWKRKAIEFENAYKETKQLFEEREKFLIKQHEAEIEAITKIQTEQFNDNLEVVLQLEKENQLLRSRLNEDNDILDDRIQIHHYQQQLPNSENTGNDMSSGSTSQLCNTAEIANRTAKEQPKENSDDLIQRINDMVIAIEGTLHQLNHSQNDSATPPLVSSDSSSDESSTDDPEQLIRAHKKKRSIRNSPNALLKIEQVDGNQDYLLGEHYWADNKMTQPILSSH